MPRFSDTEKENIKHKLLSEGEKLFAVYGLKKVTVNDLIEAANIAKATFYTFYESKEYLYMDIVQSIQKKIFIELETFLDKNKDISNKERVKQVFGMMTRLMMQYPILMQINPVTVDIISRKLPNEVLADYSQQNIDAAQVLNNHGVKFSCEVTTASYAFQALYHNWIYLQDKDKSIQNTVINILLNGLIEQIIEE